MVMDIEELYEKIKQYKDLKNNTIELNIDLVLQLVKNNIELEKQSNMYKHHINILTAQKYNLVSELKKIKIPDKIIKNILKNSLKNTE